MDPDGAGTVKTYTISPWAVPVPALSALSLKEVACQADQLAGTGTNKPIVLLPDHTPDLAAEPHARELIQAARELGWTTILVAY